MEQRVEVRIGSADANPYLALSAALASGLHGIEQGLEPEPMVQGNAYTQQFPEHLHLPTTLWEAAQRLRQSEAARELFGDAFVEHYAATREWEAVSYTHLDVYKRQGAARPKVLGMLMEF